MNREGYPMRFAAVFLSLVTLAQAAAQPAEPKLTTRLHAAHEAIQPGGRTELAVELNIDAGWHIYHPALHTGIPTVVSFDAPPGVKIGDVRFPRPSLAEAAGIEYLELSGRVVFLAPLTLDASAKPGTSLKLRATVTASACKELCLSVEETASLTLPVAAEMGKPANQKLFEEAREKIPPPLAEAPYIKGSQLSVSPDKIKIEQPAEVTATIKVQRGHHIQDRDPGVEGLIPSRLFIVAEELDGEKVDGVTFEKPIWPKPHVREMPGLGKVREQSGEVKVRVPFQITDQKFRAGPVRLRVLLQYQCCTDAGMCYPPEMAEGFIEFTADTPNAPAAAAEPPLNEGLTEDTATGSAAPESGLGKFAVMVIFGFLGGLILNITPCVLPVVSIKVLSFVQQAGEDPKRVFRLGLAFCAGIMVWFWAFAALSAAGNVPLQNPGVVLGVGSIVFVLALSLFGVFEIVLPGAAAGTLDEVTRREGYAGSFFKGLLATLLGTACTAPFLASALAYTFTQPGIVGFIIFSSAGLGMASPYLLLSAKPGWLKYVPKPGPWMVTFKQAMGFVLLATAVWLLWILEAMLGGQGVVWTIAFWGFLALAVWLLGKAKPTWETTRRLATWGVAVAVAAFGWWFSFRVMYDWAGPLGVIAAETEDEPLTAEGIIARVAASDWNDHIPWQPWQPGGLAEELSRRGYTVYVDYTADWCANCKVNELSLETDSMRAKMR
ncbi:MAG TPA: protein-disulfide reductase DsbD domain-containing protein, partial [Phycisphaerae bacterium]|nr:protein-disulfide reductase DsbD domain-containing protein [Phycisphaerae bacterium]